MLLALASLLVALTAAEWFARGRQANARTRVFAIDEERIYAPVPDVRKTFVRPRVDGDPLPIVLRFDERGYRSGEDDQGDAPEKRVLIYGDSYVEARYVPFEETFGARLAEELGPGVRTCNAGVTGYGPDQSYLRLLEELPKSEADAVVFVLFAGNDYGDLLRNKLFRIDDEGVLRRNEPVLTDALRESFAAPGGLALPSLWRKPPKTLHAIGEPPTSESVQRVIDRALISCAEEYEEYVLEGDDIVRHPFRDRYDADVSLDPEADSTHYKLRLMEALLEAVFEAARANETPLLFVFVPHVLDVCPEDVRVDRARYPLYQPASKTDHLRAMTERIGAPALDLFGPFAERCEDQLYYRVVDDHWNAKGQALAAELCAKALTDLGL